MTGIGDLLRLTTQMPSVAGGPGIMDSINQGADMLARLTRALEALVEIERPAVTSQTVNSMNVTVLPPNFIFPMAFVSRAVDVYCPATSIGGFFIDIYDENMQLSSDPIQIFPGDFRSFSVKSRGFALPNIGLNNTYQITYWN